MNREMMCPKCFIKYPVSEIEYFCNCKKEKLEEKAHNEPDINIQRELLNEASKIEPTLIKYKKGSVRCTACNDKLYNNAIRCPKCKSILPAVFFEDKVEKLPIALIGTVGAGKTLYMHMMLNEINQTKELKLIPFHVDDQTIQKHNEILNTIRKGLKVNISSDIESSMWIIKNGNVVKKDEVKTCFLNIFDIAGESQKIIPNFGTLTILSSKAILFIIDPLISNNLKNILNPNEADNSGYVGRVFNPVNLIKKTANVILQNRNKESNCIINDINIAIIFTKMDLFYENSNPKSLKIDRNTGNKLNLNTMIKESPHVKLGYFDYADCDAVNEEMTEFCTSLFGFEFLDTLYSCFTKNRCKLFGVSSTGSPPPTKDKLPSNIISHRVLDPILWILAEQDFIKYK